MSAVARTNAKSQRKNPVAQVRELTLKEDNQEYGIVIKILGGLIC